MDLKVLCLAALGLGIFLATRAEPLMLAAGAALIALGGGGFASLLIMGGMASDNNTKYGREPSFLSRFFKRKRKRQYCPTCGAPIHFVTGLGPYAGLPGGWFCGNCRKEVSPPTRSPEYRHEQRRKRRL